jgi:predicted kinase
VRNGNQTPAEALHQAYSEINRALAAGKSVVFDTTGANPAVRKAAATIARKHGAELAARVIDTPVNVCLQSQAGRANPVAASDVRRIHDAIRGQVGGLKSEGFQRVEIDRNRK